jgi:phosphatidylglycerophosphate synthase
MENISNSTDNNYIIYYNSIKRGQAGRTIYNFTRVGLFLGYVSRLITPLFIMMKVKANTITFIRSFIVLASFVMFCVNNPKNIYFPAILFALYFFFDVVDGDIARGTDKSTMLGRYFDGLVDCMAYAFIHLVYGYMLYKYELNIFYMLAGSIICSIHILGVLSIDRYQSFRRWIKEDTGEDIGDFRLGKIDKYLTFICLDLIYVSMFVSLFYFKIGAVMMLISGLLWGGRLFWYYSRLAYHNLPGYVDEPKVHFWTPK